MLQGHVVAALYTNLSCDCCCMLSPLLCRYGAQLARESTCYREAIPPRKRLAIFLHWLAHGESMPAVARAYDIAQSTVHNIVHAGVELFHDTLVPDMVVLPKGDKLLDVMRGFRGLCQLPMVCGALDGTFIEIAKPENPGLWWCYKSMYAMILLALVDDQGMFTHVDAGKPGRFGDAAVWIGSELRRLLYAGQEFAVPPVQVGDVWVHPYIVADTAFALHARVMKCYPFSGDITRKQKALNYCIIRTRRVVEQAFGRLKGRWLILVKGTPFYRDHEFVRKIALVCCGLHNFVESRHCDFPDYLQLSLQAGEQFANAFGGQSSNATHYGQAHAIRDALAEYAFQRVGHAV